MKKFIFLILSISVSAVLLANPRQQIAIDQENLSLKDQNLLNIQEFKDNQMNGPSFNYRKIGGAIAIILPLFNIGIGHREKYNSFAMDISLCLSTVALFSSLDGELKFLHYFDNTYVGGGLSTGVGFTTVIPSGLGAKPFISIGKENKKNFS